MTFSEEKYTIFYEVDKSKLELTSLSSSMANSSIFYKPKHVSIRIFLPLSIPMAYFANNS